MEWSGVLVAAFGIVALMHPTFAMGTTCTANGNQCAALTGGYCDLDAANGGPKCACAAINEAATVATTCTPISCLADANVCSTADSNSECIKDVCSCKATFELTGADKSAVCLAKVIGSSCTEEGGECAAIAGAFCVTAGKSPVCACTDTQGANQDGSQCTTKNNAVVTVASMALLFICCLPVTLSSLDSMSSYTTTN
ncbi:uncharacterized protein LOC128232875 [Mya arenaria]|uniref:uncharacterized protein LOC128232875 n=1 Tax=Mya arenaria TaxID=6604 RepID=UPI0022E23CAE|nr:uncharacterized protein LOC128232875 [Mya arenaria]